MYLEGTNMDRSLPQVLNGSGITSRWCFPFSFVIEWLVVDGKSIVCETGTDWQGSWSVHEVYVWS